MLLVKIAFRNLFRQRRRSLLTGMAMVAGYVLTSLSMSVGYGSYGHVIDTFTRSHIGHLQVHRQGYLEDPSLYKTFSDPDTVGKTIAGTVGMEAWTPRVYGHALAFIGQETTMVQLLGVVPEREDHATRLSQRVDRGAYLDPAESRRVLLEKTAAEILDAEPGDEVALISQAADGSIANAMFTVAAVLEGGGGGLTTRAYVHLRDLQEFLVLPGQVHEIAVLLDDYRRAEQAAERLRNRLQDRNLEIDPWQAVAKDFYQAMQADIEGMWISLIVIMIIVGIGVLNTVLMSILERTREYGVLKALGTSPGRLFALVQLETFFLAGLSVLVGALLAWPVDAYFVFVGMAYPEPISVGGYTVSRLLGEFNAAVFLVPAAVVWGTAALVSIFPAARAARLQPARAMAK